MPSYVCILHRLKCKNNSVNKRNFETYRATYLGGYPSLCGTYPILYLYIYIYPHVIQSGQVARTTQSVQTLGDSSCNFSLSTGLSTTYWECYSCFPLTAVTALNKEKLVHVGSAFNQKKTKNLAIPKELHVKVLASTLFVSWKRLVPSWSQKPTRWFNRPQRDGWVLGSLASWHRSNIQKQGNRVAPQLLAGFGFFSLQRETQLRTCYGKRQLDEDGNSDLR